MKFVIGTIKTLFYLAIFIGFIWFLGRMSIEDDKRHAEICHSFGPNYEWRSGSRSPDLCVDNKAGEVRYP